MTQRQLQAQTMHFPNLNAFQFPKVRRSMRRIKHVLREREREQLKNRIQGDRSSEMKRMVN
ncbi:predicted protein, partial [Arabidopsis lyrata subsp. lyrata]